MALAKIKFPIAVADFVPHYATMSLLRRILSHSKNATLCDVHIDSSSSFLIEGYVEAWIGLEYMAQAVAAHAGMQARTAGKSVEIGFLLGTRRIDFFTDRYSIGQTLVVSARHVWGEGDLFCFDCSITSASDGKCLASAQLNVYRPGSPDPILKGKKK